MKFLKTTRKETCVLQETLRWRHNDHAGVSNHQPPGCLLNRLFRRKSKKTSKLRVTGLCAGNSPGTGEFSAQMASYAENVSIWWRHHDFAHILQDYTQTCNISRSFVGNNIVDHSDVVGASPVSAAPTTLSRSETKLRWCHRRHFSWAFFIIYTSVYIVKKYNGRIFYFV